MLWSQKTSYAPWFGQWGNTIHHVVLANVSMRNDVAFADMMDLLVAARCALPGVFRLPLQTQSLGATEGRASPHFLLLLAVYTFQNSLLGLQGLGLSLGLSGHSFFLRLRSHDGKDTCWMCDSLHSRRKPIRRHNQLVSAPRTGNGQWKSCVLV